MSSAFRITVIGFALLACSSLGAVAQQATPKSAEAQHAGEQFFERKIRPLLIEHCHKCHAGDKPKGGLKVDSLAALIQGGESGAAIVPGDAQRSVLMQAIRWDESFVQMPPMKKLPASAIADVERWINLGAPWPGVDPTTLTAVPKRTTKEITAEDRAYWAFQPIRRPMPPQLKSSSVDLQPLDAFVLKRLADKRLTPNPSANKRELIRRAYFDLIGLPPTPDEVARFEADASPRAFARVIDELLARPQYGERWARHWLDVVRYAQTNGYERDSEKPYAWRYRDYVIRAFNQDKPYDRFVLEQLAGDELDDADDDALIATGFYRLGVWDDEPDDARAAEFDGLDDIMVSTGAAFMGLTIGCARCHEHRFDPIPQEDYYRLLTFMRSVRPYANSTPNENSPGFVPLGDRQANRARFEGLKQQTAALQEQIKTEPDKKLKKQLEDEVARLTREATAQLEWALAVRDGGDQPTHVLIRGNAATPGEKVEPGFLSVIHAQPPTIVKPAHASSSGRRLSFARWLTSPDHPLTARVMANRVWKHHFGRGIVPTTSDFGKGGLPPTHPELLDWLARELIDNGWSLKQLHKTIMLSQTYQMSSHVGHSAAAAVDPGNDFLWRQNLRRLEAEAIRDSVLAVSGKLNDAMGGRGFYPHLAGEVLSGGSRPGDGWQVSSNSEQNRRSIYAYIKRSMVPPIFEGFDYATTASPLPERQVTTVAPQALMLLNDPFMLQQAQALAERLEQETSADAARRIERAYQLVLARRPSPRESQIAQAYLARQSDFYASLASRLTFAPDVPSSLHSSYLNRLQPLDFLLGPREAWHYGRGKWTGGYEGLMTVDRQRGPFALWQGPAFADGVVQARLTLQNAAEFGTLIVRGTAEGESYRGYELVLDAREQLVELRRLAADVVRLSEVDRPLATGKPLSVKIALAGPRIRVWLDSAEPIIDVVDPQPMADAGRLGVRAWGAAMSLDQVQIEALGRTFDLATTPVVSDSQRSSNEAPQGWQPFGGRWSLGDDGTYSVEPAAGAKSIWRDGPSGDGVVEADVMLRAPGGDGGLLVSVSQCADGVDTLHGYNINVLNNALRLGKHQNNWRELKRLPFDFGVNRWHHVRVETLAGRIRVFVDGAKEPQLDYQDERPLPAGQLGLRTFNARFAIKDLRVTQGGKTTLAKLQLPPPSKPLPAPALAPLAHPQRKALASLCLLLFNLNEFLYID